MATSKTLAPTNVTISIPAMTDAPNASVLSNCIDKEADAINTLNSQIGSGTTWVSVPAGGSATVTMSSKGFWAFYRVYRPTIVFIRTNGTVELTVGETTDLTFSLSGTTLTITNPATWAVNCWLLG